MWLALIAFLVGMASAEGSFAVMGWAAICVCAGSVLWLVTPPARVTATLVAFALVSVATAILLTLFSPGSEMLAGTAALLIIAAIGTALAGYRARGSSRRPPS